jgi:hypothetical protein
MSRRLLSIVALIAVHVAAAIVLAVLAEDGEPTITLALFVGLTFCQTSLIGMWGGLGFSHWCVRFASVALGISLLALLFNWGLSSQRFLRWFEVDPQIVVLVALCTLATTCVMLVVRRRTELRLVAADAATAIALPREGLQFSILHLIVLTFVVASLTALGKWLHPYLANVDNFIHLATLGLCFVAVGLGAPWATLGSGSPMLRSGIVMAIALGAGFVPMLLNNFWHVGFWLTVMLSEAGLLLLSLSVIRKCGFRLVRRGTLPVDDRPIVVAVPTPITLDKP